jgi:hypothetical protein
MNAQSRSGNFPHVYKVFRTLNPSVDEVDAIKASLAKELAKTLKNDFGEDWVQVKESDLEITEEILLEYLVSKLSDLEALGHNSTGSSCMIESMKSLYTFSISRLLEQCSKKDSDFHRSVSKIVELGVSAEANRSFIEKIFKSKIDNDWNEYEILCKLFNLFGFVLKQ